MTSTVMSLSAWQKLAKARHRRQASEAHAQLRQLEEEKLKAKATKARNQRNVLCWLLRSQRAE